MQFPKQKKKWEFETTTKMKNKLILLLMHILALLEDNNKNRAEGFECRERNPSGIQDGIEPRDEDSGFHLLVSGNPKSYQPGELYTISLKVRNNVRSFIQSGAERNAR